MIGVTPSGARPSNKRCNAVSVPPHSAGLYFRKTWATRISTSSGAGRFEQFSLRRCVFPRLLALLDLSFLLAQAIHAGKDSHEQVNGEHHLRLAEHPLRQALQKDAAETKENPDRNAPQRIGDARPQEGGGHAEPPDPEQPEE